MRTIGLVLAVAASAWAGSLDDPTYGVTIQMDGV